MKPFVSAEQIRAILEEDMEPSEPITTIFNYLRSRDGKALTQRDVSKLEELCAQHKTPTDVRISKEAGMTHLTWGGYIRSGGRSGGSLLVAYVDKGAYIDAAWIEEHNAGYFSARVERNAQREAALKDPLLFVAAADAINRLLLAKRDIDALLEHDNSLGVARYAIMDLFKDA